jgi:peroxiredoxin
MAYVGCGAANPDRAARGARLMAMLFRKGSLVFVLVAALTIAACERSETAKDASARSAGDAVASSDPIVPAGDVAPDFELTNLKGAKVSLKSLRGKVIFLNVWATWCGPCREEMPSMETLFEDFKSNKDFVMLAVSQDHKGRAAVLPYVEKNGYRFEILLDPENAVSESYNVAGVPESFIIDRKGRIVAHHMGAFDWARADVREAMRALLDARDV